MHLQDEKFTKAIVDILLRRAANQCSNPECAAITSGPSTDINKAVLIGEAAHIFGGQPGSARYDPTINSSERRAITNALWLCRNCHKKIDADPVRFPAELLFRWRSSHEEKMDEKVGRANDLIRRQIAQDETPEFEKLSQKAKQIIYDKPDGWEYLLTADILKNFCEPTLLRWRALKKGLYVRPIARVQEVDALLWTVDRMSELGQIIPACTLICNEELLEA